MLAAGARVAVAASGGADSTALLLLLEELAPVWGLQLSVVHVQHGLRPEAAAEAEFASQLAARRHLPFRRFDLQPPSAGVNLEQWARRRRYACFRRLLRAGAADLVATGHHLDDQAETVLLRLLRGAGPRGLVGIWPVLHLDSPGSLRAGAAPARPGCIRPLLQLSRRQLQAYLRQRGQPWREDASNRSPRFLRNRIRLELLPLLARAYHPALPASLARLAELMRAEELDWAARVEPLVAGLWQPAGPDRWQADIRPLLACSLALRRRLVRAGLEMARGAPLPAAWELVDLLCQWLESAAGRPPRRRAQAGLEVVVNSRCVAIAKSPSPSVFG